MWQSIQTLYLVIAIALTAVLLAGNAAALTGEDGLTLIRYTAIAKPYMLILLIVLTLIESIALIAFKVRILQMRLSVVAGLVALGAGLWVPRDRDLPARDRHLRFPRRPRRLPGPARSRERPTSPLPSQTLAGHFERSRENLLSLHHEK